jgi:hypothetical protein
LPQRLLGKKNFRTDGRCAAQWSRLKAGYSDDLGFGRRQTAPTIPSAKGGDEVGFDFLMA